MTADNPLMPDAEALYQTLCAQIRAAYPARGAIALAGIQSGGAWLAQRLAADLDVPFGTINVSLHRDDFAQKGLPAAQSPTKIPFDVEQYTVIVVDDVLSTGRTVRAAVNELFDYGRVAAVELAVLADRGGRELPIAPRFCGGELAVSDDTVLVLSQQHDGRFVLTTEERA